MTAKQRALYWRTWTPVRKALIDLGGFTAAEAEAERHALHEQALGRKKSSKDFANRDLDKVLDEFDRAAVLIAGPSDSDRRQEQPRNRLIYAIERTGLPEAYLEAIARDQFKTSDWRSLTERQLTRFRYTATARARAKAKST